MANDTTKKAANLTTFMLVQDFLPGHWNWGPSELGTLGDVGAMGSAILKRLQAAGLEVKEAYAIAHDKDEHELWNEYKNDYEIKPDSEHIHFVCKLANGAPLETIAKIIGVTPNFIARPKTGRYSYDNMLSYLIHVKYPTKYQYKPNNVTAIAGKEYIEYFREYYRRWIHGRAVKILKDAEYDLKDVKRMILEGTIGQYELLTEERFKYVYQLHITYG